MININFLLLILLYVIIFGVVCYLIKKIKQEYQLYRSFTKNDGMRNLMAKDPLRFHNSIVYLMVCAMHSNYTSLQYDKLKLIVRYICEVCPVVYQKEMLVNLKKLIGDEEIRNRFSGEKSIINIDYFLEGKPDFIKEFVIYSYVLPLNGVGLAEEMSKILTEDDKIYLMYILFRVATANGKFTTTGSESSLVVMNKLCVDGLKIAKEELDLLIQQYTNKNLQGWYDEHFGRKRDLYPSFDQIGNIFRSEDKPFAFVDQVNDTVMTKSVYSLFLLIIILNLVMYTVIRRFDNVHWWFIYATFILLVFNGYLGVVFSHKYESVQYYILRTKKENKWQIRNLIICSVYSLFIIFSILWCVSYLLFLEGYKLWWI